MAKNMNIKKNNKQHKVLLLITGYQEKHSNFVNRKKNQSYEIQLLKIKKTPKSQKAMQEIS